MIRYLRSVVAAQFRQGKTLVVLSVLGVALGVGSVLGIQIINRNAIAAFRGSVRAVSGDADLTVVGRTPVLPDSIYPRILAVRGVGAAWPLVRVDVAVNGTPDLFLDVVGTDLFASHGTSRQGTGRGLGAWTGGVNPADPLIRPGWVAVSTDLARDRGWAVGDTLTVSSGSRVTGLRIGALVDYRRLAPMANRKLALMDISQVQAFLTRRGELQEVDVRLAPGASLEAVRGRLSRVLGPSVQVLTAPEREERVAGLLEAFRVNLTALSLISLFVGMFLILSSTQAALVRRRAELGLLRSLGATRGQVLGVILGEVALVGALGTLLGIPLGIYAAASNLKVVSGTLTNIYLLQEVDRVHLPAALVLLAAAIGIGGALLGGLGPALDMSRRDTRALLVTFTLQERTSRAAPGLALAAVGVLAVAVGWFALWGHAVRWGGFGLGLAVLVTLPLFTPLLMRAVCGRVQVRGFGFAYSVRGLVQKLLTSATAVAALTVAVSMLVGITLLVGSFRSTLETWVETTIQGDVYITTQSWARAGRDAVLTDDVVRRLTRHEGVAGAEPLREFRVMTGNRRIRLAGVGILPGARGRRIPLRSGDPERALEAVRQDGAALVSEPLARKAGLSVGDTLRIMTPRGPAGIPIAGISYDYTTEQGAALVDLSTLVRLFGPGPVNNLALYLKPGVSVDGMVDRLRTEFAGTPLLIRSNRQLRAEIFRVFDQTFAVTRVLQVMALLVAGAGISLTLLVLARERTAELALYRALGALRRQIFLVFLGEGMAMGILGLLLGTLGGVGLAAILIFILNPAYFGWTIRPAWTGPELLREAVAILAAAGLAALYPAFRASRTPAPELSRDAP